LEALGCAVFKTFAKGNIKIDIPSYSLAMFLSRYYNPQSISVSSASTHAASLKLQRRISKSVPTYLGRSFEPTK
jgi:hypothetical protein